MNCWSELAPIPATIPIINYSERVRYPKTKKGDGKPSPLRAAPREERSAYSQVKMPGDWAKTAGLKLRYPPTTKTRSPTRSLFGHNTDCLKHFNANKYRTLNLMLPFVSACTASSHLQTPNLLWRRKRKNEDDANKYVLSEMNIAVRNCYSKNVLLTINSIITAQKTSQ